MLKKIFKDSVFEKIVLLLFLFISLFLFSVYIVLGQVTIDNVDIPTSVQENTNLTVSFAASTDTENDITYSIYYDNILVSTTDTFTTLVNYSSSGVHTFSFFASDIVSNVTENHSIDIINVPAIITIISPASRTYNSRTINITADISTYADQCLYSINGSINGALSGSGQNFYGSITLGQDGGYIIVINCSNAFDTSITSTAFNIDTVNPVILSKSYTVDSSNVVTLNAATDVACSCRYDSSDKSYDSMLLSFINTNGLQHSTTISGLADSSFTYYIKCRSMINNATSNSEVVSFNIVTKPSASVYISKSSPLKAGTYEVRLTTNKPVIGAPSLYYNFDNDLTPRYVTLTGSDADWQGYLIIEDNTPNRVGTFHYSATDYNGNVGTSISDGQLFLVDTIKPTAPSSLEANNLLDGSIKLKWYYDTSEEVNRYNVYRSTSGDPDYVDYYDSTASKQYIDHDVIDGVTYYYRIAAVDDADNDGLLSEVLQATSNKIVTVSDTGKTVAVQQVLDPGLIPKVDQLVAEFNTYLDDIAAAKSELDKTNDPDKLKIIDILKLSENTKTAQATINGIITQANNLKNQNLKTSELDVQLNKLKMDAIKAKSLVAEDIIVNEQSAYTQVTQASDVDQAISEILSVNLSRDILNNYSLTNRQLQDNIAVETDILIFKIKYVGKDDYDKYTLVKKIVSSSKELANISIVELIPKSFEDKASNMIFDIDSQPKPIIVKEDPVLRWDVDTFNKQTTYYMINSNAEMSAAKNTKTLVLYRPDFKVTQTANTDANNKLTGFVGLGNINISSISLIQWLVVLGVGLIIGLSAYYVTLDRKDKKRNSQRLKDHKIITRTMNARTTLSTSRPTQPAQSSQPVQVIKSSIQSGVSSQFDINSELDKANILINNFDYENSRMIYNLCMQKYDVLPLRKASEKNDMKLMLDHLYLKLTVYRTIYASRKHVNAKDYKLLKQDILLINKIYTKLYSNLNTVDDDHKDAERKFIDYVANSKRHLEGLAL